MFRNRPPLDRDASGTDDDSTPVRSYETVASNAFNFITTKVAIEDRIAFFLFLKKCWLQQTQSNHFAQEDLLKIHQFMGDLIVHLVDAGAKYYTDARIADIRKFYSLTNEKETTKNTEIQPDLMAQRYMHRLKRVLSKLNEINTERFDIATQQYHYGFISNIVILKSGAPWVAIEFNPSMNYQEDSSKYWFDRRDRILATVANLKAVQYWETKSSPSIECIDKKVKIEIKQLLSTLLPPTNVIQNPHEIGSSFRFLAAPATPSNPEIETVHVLNL